MSSKIFSSFRALGLTTNHVPLDVRYNSNHNENYVVTCVGKSFHTYNCSRLGIVNISNLHDDQINVLAASGNLVFTACNNVAYANYLGKEIMHEYKNHQHPIKLLLPFGAHLLSVDENSFVTMFDINSEEAKLEMNFNPDSFNISAIVHPSTYVNKVLFGSKQGSLQLWNLKNKELIYTFEGWESEVVILAQSPAVDIIGIGLQNGRILLHNLKFDEEIMSFIQDWGSVISLSFRSDDKPYMVSGSLIGHIAIWDLEKKCLHSELVEAHSGPVNGLKCLPNEPLMITSSADNSIKVWIFDTADGGARLLRHRSGHSQPPTCVKYSDFHGDTIISAGEDSTLRTFSTKHDSHNRSMGRASYKKRASQRSGLKNDQHMMPPIFSFATETNKMSDWDSVLACHRDEAKATTWNMQRCNMGKYQFLHPRYETNEYKDVQCTCVDISPCGNFGVLGYSSGHIDIYNMQSGIYRGSIGGDKGAHNKPVRGVVFDNLNQIVITSSADCFVKFWYYKSKAFISKIHFKSPIAKMILHRESNLLAVCTDDFCVYVIDCIFRRVVRIFEAHTNAVTDMAFKSDGRWLMTSSMDRTIRTWDVPFGKLIDCFLLDIAATSIDISPTHDLLVTTHVDELGLYLWSNMTMFQSNVFLPPLELNFVPEDVSNCPTADYLQNAKDNDEIEIYENGSYEDPTQIDKCITLSNVARSRWQNLLQLEVIKQRNKPKEPPKVPKAAPFFLPTVPGLELSFDVSGANKKTENEEKKNISSIDKLLPLSKFAEKLDSNKYDEAFDILMKLSPSALDAEFRLLSPIAGGTMSLLNEFCMMILGKLETKMDFEINSDMFIGCDEIMKNLYLINGIIERDWKFMNYELDVCLALTNYFKSIAL